MFSNTTLTSSCCTFLITGSLLPGEASLHRELNLAGTARAEGNCVGKWERGGDSGMQRIIVLHENTDQLSQVACLCTCVCNNGAFGQDYSSSSLEHDPSSGHL